MRKPLIVHYLQRIAESLDRIEKHFQPVLVTAGMPDCKEPDIMLFGKSENHPELRREGNMIGTNRKGDTDETRD